MAHQETSAEGSIPLLGEGEITVEADFGIALASHAVRVVASGIGEAATEGTSTYENEKVVKGDDQCQWYNPADWAGNCDSDETVTYHTEKEDTNTCNREYNIVTDPSLAGDWIAERCKSSAGENVVCMEAKAEAFADSNVGDAGPLEAEASNCDSESAIRIIQYFQQGMAQVSSVNQIEDPDRPCLIRLDDLPTELRESMTGDAREQILATVTNDLETKYYGDTESREQIVPPLIDAVSDALDGYDGWAIVSFTQDSGTE